MDNKETDNPLQEPGNEYNNFLKVLKAPLRFKKTGNPMQYQDNTRPHVFFSQYCTFKVILLDFLG